MTKLEKDAVSAKITSLAPDAGDDGKTRDRVRTNITGIDLSKVDLESPAGQAYAKEYEGRVAKTHENVLKAVTAEYAAVIVRNGGKARDDGAVIDIASGQQVPAPTPYLPERIPQASGKTR